MCRVPSSVSQARKRSSGSFVFWELHAIAVAPLPITPPTHPPPLRVVVGLAAHDVVKGDISTSEDVPMHSLGYELPRIHLLGTSVNRPWALLRASPLHAFHHLLRLRCDLIEVGSQPAVVDGHRFAFDVLQDGEANLISLVEG